MNSKYTLALFALFVGLAAAAYFLGRDREPTNMTAGTATPTPAPMVDLEASAVQEVAVGGADGEMTLTRVAGGWEVDGEPAADTVGETIERLSPPEVIRVLEGRDPDDYGFASPSLTITLKTQEGTEHVLFFGDDTPVDGNVYVRVGPEGPIYIVSGTDVTTVRGWLTSPPLAATATSEATEVTGTPEATVEPGTPGTGEPEEGMTATSDPQTPTPESEATETPSVGASATSTPTSTVGASPTS
jgi:hypothetical protein